MHFERTRGFRIVLALLLGLVLVDSHSMAKDSSRSGSVAPLAIKTKRGVDEPPLMSRDRERDGDTVHVAASDLARVASLYLPAASKLRSALRARVANSGSAAEN